MYVEVYVEMLLLYEFVLDLCILLLTETIWNRKRRILGHLAAAAVGSTFGIVYLLPMGVNSYLKYIVFLPLYAVVMLRIAFGKQRWYQMLYYLLTMVLLAILLGGMLTRLLNCIPGDSFIRVILAMPIITILLKGLILYIKRKRKKVIPVSLFTKEGRVGIYALFDSGNGLRDVSSDKGICILEEGICDCKSLIPLPNVSFSSIGKEGGSLPVYQIEKIIVHSYAQDLVFKKVPVAISDAKLSPRHNYQMILHEDYICENKG